MLKTIQLGIIGIGFGQYVHLPAFRTVDGIEVRGIAATSLERARKVAELHNIPHVYSSWQDIVQDPDIDALVVAVPPSVQQDIILEALSFNKHLFCEKPLALSSEQSLEFVVEAKLRKLANMVNFEFCVVPAWIRARNLLQSAMLGNLKLGVLNWQVETYANRMKLDNWKVKPEKGGGVVFNFLPHVLYNLEWLCGPISEVFMVNRLTSKKDYTAVHGIIKFTNALVFSICVGTASFGGNDQRIEIYGENGSLKLFNETSDFMDGFICRVSLRDCVDTKEYTESFFVENKNHKGDSRIPAVKILAKRFADWIFTDEPQEPSFSQGHRVSLLIEACKISQESQNWVSINDLDFSKKALGLL